MSEGKPEESGMSRRDFLKAAGGMALASVLPSEVLAEKKYTIEGSPFDPETVRATLEIVAREMHYKLDPAVDPVPVVISLEGMPDKEFDELFGFPTNGKRVNIFRPPNKVYLCADSSVHNLAHELTHYIQSREALRRGGPDTRDEEDDPIRIQNMFR